MIQRVRSCSFAMPVESGASKKSERVHSKDDESEGGSLQHHYQIQARARQRKEEGREGGHSCP